jgi:hypothetical protein
MDLADCIAPAPVIFSSIFYERSEMKILQLQQHLHQVKCQSNMWHMVWTTITN